MTKRLVNVGEGRIVEMTEVGQVPPDPTPKPRPPRHKNPGKHKGKRKKSKEPYVKPKGKRPPGFGSRIPDRDRGVPGYKEWLMLRFRQVYRLHDRSRKNIPDGMRKKEAELAWAEARRKAKLHMANLKNAGLLSDDEIVVKATQATLEILESPMNQDHKLKAAKQLLDFYKAKPVSKSEVTVNAAEAWLASLAEDVSKQND